MSPKAKVVVFFVGVALLASSLVSGACEDLATCALCKADAAECVYCSIKAPSEPAASFTKGVCRPKGFVCATGGAALKFGSFVNALDAYTTAPAMAYAEVATCPASEADLITFQKATFDAATETCAGCKATKSWCSMTNMFGTGGICVDKAAQCVAKIASPDVTTQMSIKTGSAAVCPTDKVDTCYKQKTCDTCKTDTKCSSCAVEFKKGTEVMGQGVCTEAATACQSSTVKMSDFLNVYNKFEMSTPVYKQNGECSDVKVLRTIDHLLPATTTCATCLAATPTRKWCYVESVNGRGGICARQSDDCAQVLTNGKTAATCAAAPSASCSAHADCAACKTDAQCEPCGVDMCYDGETGCQNTAKYGLCVAKGSCKKAMPNVGTFNKPFSSSTTPPNFVYQNMTDCPAKNFVLLPTMTFDYLTCDTCKNQTFGWCAVDNKPKGAGGLCLPASQSAVCTTTLKAGFTNATTEFQTGETKACPTEYPVTTTTTTATTTSAGFKTDSVVLSTMAAVVSAVVAIQF